DGEDQGDGGVVGDDLGQQARDGVDGEEHEPGVGAGEGEDAPGQGGRSAGDFHGASDAEGGGDDDEDGPVDAASCFLDGAAAGENHDAGGEHGGDEHAVDAGGGERDQSDERDDGDGGLGAPAGRRVFEGADEEKVAGAALHLTEIGHGLDEQHITKGKFDIAELASDAFAVAGDGDDDAAIAVAEAPLPD